MTAVTVRWLARQPYAHVYAQMQAVIDQSRRDPSVLPQLWLLEHDPVYTLGRAADEAHLLAPGDIPVVQTDRGGQVTYHGPGQLMVYTLFDLEAMGLGVRRLVTQIEQSIVDLLADSGISAVARRDAPGVYIDAAGQSTHGAKIASLGLRVTRARSYHGLALNVAMDTSPFQRINPCGMAGLAMTQTSALGGPGDVRTAARGLIPHLARHFELELPHNWQSEPDCEAAVE